MNIAIPLRGVSMFYVWQYCHYSDVIMGAMASQITSLTIVYSTVYSGAQKRKHQISASLAFVRGIHRWPMRSPHKLPVTWKMFPFDDVIMVAIKNVTWTHSPVIHRPYRFFPWPLLCVYILFLCLLMATFTQAACGSLFPKSPSIFASPLARQSHNSCSEMIYEALR